MKKLFVSHSCPFVVLLFHLSCISWFIPSSTYARRKRRAGAPSTHYFLPYEKTIRVPFVSIRGSIIPPFVYFVYFVVHSLLNVRAAEATRGRAQARQPRTTFFPMKKLFVSHSCPFVVLLFHLSCISCISWFIPSSTYARRKRRAGAPTRASHALPSTFFSLLSTFETIP